LTYCIALERFDLNYDEMEPIYRQHYAEMNARLEADGLPTSPFNPRLDQYFQAARDGWLLNIIARTDEGEAVGYCNVYITNDMHSGEVIAQEDAIYVLPEHRNGLGKKMVRFVLAHLEASGVTLAYVEPVTDLRVAKIWQRMGFREVSTKMVYRFKGKAHVCS